MQIFSKFSAAGFGFMIAVLSSVALLSSARADWDPASSASASPSDFLYFLRHKPPTMLVAFDAELITHPTIRVDKLTAEVENALLIERDLLNDENVTSTQRVDLTYLNRGIVVNSHIPGGISAGPGSSTAPGGRTTKRPTTVVPSMVVQLLPPSEAPPFNTIPKYCHHTACSVAFSGHWIKVYDGLGGQSRKSIGGCELAQPVNLCGDMRVVTLQVRSAWSFDHYDKETRCDTGHFKVDVQGYKDDGTTRTMSIVTYGGGDAAGPFLRFAFRCDVNVYIKGPSGSPWRPSSIFPGVQHPLIPPRP